MKFSRNVDAGQLIKALQRFGYNLQDKPEAKFV